MVIDLLEVEYYCFQMQNKWFLENLWIYISQQTSYHLISVACYWARYFLVKGTGLLGMCFVIYRRNGFQLIDCFANNTLFLNKNYLFVGKQNNAMDSGLYGKLLPCEEDEFNQ